jgi:hypothetical protein
MYAAIDGLIGSSDRQAKHKEKQKLSLSPHNDTHDIYSDRTQMFGPVTAKKRIFTTSKLWLNNLQIDQVEVLARLLAREKCGQYRHRPRNCHIPHGKNSA